MVSVIAIDGPAAAGKTVVGRALARRLGLKYRDTGLMYRAITWLALQQGTPMADEAALGCLANTYPVRLVGREGEQVLVGEHQIGLELGEPQINNNVSLVARIPEVRRALVRQQRTLAAEGGIVIVGRDIGTVVAPDADLKVFLSAAPEVRAQRRWLEFVEQGRDTELSQVLQETKARDEIDSRRADSPMKPAQDAFILDTGELSICQVVEQILHRIQGPAGAGK